MAGEGAAGSFDAGYVWEPSAEQAAATNVMHFAQAHGIDDYHELLRRSQVDPSWFWEAVVRHLDIRFDAPYSSVLDVSRGIEWPTWFTGGTLNIAWNAAGRWAAATPEAPAVVSEDESGEARSLTYAELWRDVRRAAAGLRALGVRQGDRVGLFLPMIVEAAVASHACALLGAVQVPLFSGLAAPAVALRLRDAQAKVVITADVTVRRGSTYAMKTIVDEAASSLPDLSHVVVVERAGRTVAAPRDVGWTRLLDAAGADIEPVPLPSEHPCYLGYTSGTTGKPKAAVHSTAGLLVKILAEAAFQTDLRSEDTLCWVTDLGWLMGAWEILGATGLGATVLLAEGAPNVPADRLWTLCERHRVTVLGLAPTLVRGLAPHGADPVRRHDLSSLRVLGSTGEPWDEASYRWLADVVGGGRLPIINMSGGTEVGACFLSASPALPIKAASVGGPSLGMAVDVVDAAGRPVRGAVGELVCRAPWPSHTRGLWRDDERYLEAYWRRFPGVWAHGDWALVDDDGCWFLFGRSDDTLNVAGKRVGPSELEAALLRHPDVVEAGVAGLPDPLKGEAPWCFCVLRDGVELGDELRAALTEQVVSVLGASFRPRAIVSVRALPKTRSGKIVRRALRTLAGGGELDDVSALEDPGVVEELRRALERSADA